MSEAPDSTTERSPMGSAWVNRLISAALGIVVTVIGALVIGRLQERSPNLSYSSTESLPFNGPNGEVSIYQVTISNDGKSEASDVACIIQIPTGKIEQYKLTASPLLNAVGTGSGNSVTVQVPNLNPAESFQVSLLASGTQDLPSRPQVLVRARGILGAQKNPGNERSQPESALQVSATAISAVIASGAFMLLLRRRQPSVSSLFSGASGDDQRQVLAYICRAYGLTGLADQYSAQPHETTYWAEADRLGRIATDSGDVTTMTAVENALLALIEYDPALHKRSKAIVYYNVALINHFKKNAENYKKYLNLARETSSGEITRRLKIDLRFSPL